MRSVLRRHLPGNVSVGRGFVVAMDDSSTQIDVLIVDNNKPTLFKEGDLYIVTPEAVLGAIEVKTKLNTKAGIGEALTKLLTVEDMCRDVTGRDTVWTGLFIFEEHEGGQDPKVLESIAQAYKETKRIINSISIGKNLFVRFWKRGADVNSLERGPVWHSYQLPEIAPSYFLGNLIDHVAPMGSGGTNYAWFPALGGKEQYRSHYLPLGVDNPIRF